MSKYQKISPKTKSVSALFLAKHVCELNKELLYFPARGKNHSCAKLTDGERCKKQEEDERLFAKPRTVLENWKFKSYM